MANPARTCADPSIKLRNQARFSWENRSPAARTLASTVAKKPSTEHGFLRKSGADLPGPKHVAQKRSTVLRGPEHLPAKFYRARFSPQTRRGPKHFAQEPARSRVFLAKPAQLMASTQTLSVYRTPETQWLWRQMSFFFSFQSKIGLLIEMSKPKSRHIKQELLSFFSTPKSLFHWSILFLAAACLFFNLQLFSAPQ